jgi:hypothetical protein
MEREQEIKPPPLKLNRHRCSLDIEAYECPICGIDETVHERKEKAENEAKKQHPLDNYK